MLADWTQLGDADFSVACGDLGDAIGLPLKIGFRNRLRSKTTVTQATLAPVQPLPTPQYVVTGGLPHPSTAWLLPVPQPSTPSGGGYMATGVAMAPSYTTPRSSQPPFVDMDIRSSNSPAPPSPSTEAVATVEPTAAAAPAKQSQLTRTANTVSTTVDPGGSAGETLRLTRLRGVRERTISSTHT